MHSISMNLLRSAMSKSFQRNFCKYYPCRCAKKYVEHCSSENKQMQQMTPFNNFNEQVQTAAMVKNPINLQIDWDSEMQRIEMNEKEHEQSILSPVVEESKIYAEPMLRPTYNLAAYVQKSETLQQLVKLGVDLSELDRLAVGQFIVNLDFKTDIEPYIMFLTQNVGIAIDDLGFFFTKNPNVLREHLDDISTRINYLELKRFTRDEIVSIVTRNVFWLNYSTRDIDGRLGFVQKHFELSGNEMRTVTVACPKLITHKLIDIEQISFSIREECGFDRDQVRQLVQKCPKLWMMRMFILNFERISFIGGDLFLFLFSFSFSDRYVLMKRYDFITNNMKIDNNQLVLTPHILEQRLFRIKERHGFLKKIGRDQYNPKLPLYISIDELCKGNDDHFAIHVAKQTYEEYDSYLRTL